MTCEVCLRYIVVYHLNCATSLQCEQRLATALNICMANCNSSCIRGTIRYRLQRRELTVDIIMLLIGRRSKM